MLNSSVIRVFKKYYPLDANPKIEQIVSDDVAYYAHTVLRAGIQFNAWYKVGTSKIIDEETVANVIFGYPNIIKDNPLENWGIWKINTDFLLVGKLPKEYWDILEPGGVETYVEIISRIKFDYYRYTRVEYDVLKRKPLENVDSFIRVTGDTQTIYYQFKGNVL